MSSLSEVLGAALPEDASFQDHAARCVRRVRERADQPWRQIMDLGCGEGNTIDLFRAIAPEGHWIGLDIESSPEVNLRRRSDGDFRVYDGVNIPLDDESLDVIFTSQAFEHVHYPQEIIRHVARVLRPGGYFLGSTSFLEPYHSYSTFGYTPYGWKVLMEQAGLTLEEVRPGVDVLSILVRRRLGFSEWLRDRWYYSQSPMNRMIDLVAWMRGWKPRKKNAMKLYVAGIFTFVARKPA